LAGSSATDLVGPRVGMWDCESVGWWAVERAVWSAGWTAVAMVGPSVVCSAAYWGSKWDSWWVQGST
jgi:hypothetical protein